MFRFNRISTCHPLCLPASATLVRPRMVWSPNPQLQSGDLGTAKIYDWADGQGRKAKGVLFLPVGYESGKRYPLVIEARSYSQDRFVVDGTYSTAVAARAMAAAGLMVLQAGEPVLRRDDFFSKELGASAEGYAAAIDKLGAAGLIDPNRVGIIGFSRTCSNVLYALTKQPRLFAAATLANGIVYGFSQYLFYLDYGDNNMANKQYHAVYGGPPLGLIWPLMRRTIPFSISTGWQRRSGSKLIRPRICCSTGRPTQGCVRWVNRWI